MIKEAFVTFRMTEREKTQLGRMARACGYRGVSALLREAVEMRCAATFAMDERDRTEIRELALLVQRLIAAIQQSTLAGTPMTDDEIKRSARLVGDLERLSKTLSNLHGRAR